MTGSSEHQITHLLREWRGGDPKALERLTPMIYRELYRAARRCMGRERDGHTLQPTALINELYLRLGDLRQVDWQNRAHFFALCARQMRRILTDAARTRQAEKRGGGAFVVSLDEAPDVTLAGREEVVAVDDALTALAQVDEETAAVLQVSADTVARDWRLAKAWLLREMGKRVDGA
jgi:RNA polymerase sigma-70 factor, ECF subfamily